MKKRVYISIIIIALLIIISLIVYKPLLAFFTDSAQKVNQIPIGKVSASITEPNYEDNKPIVPAGERAKDPTFSNNGTVDSYIRAQVYVPISDQIKYVDENEQIVTPTNNIELISYQINSGWEKIEEEGYTGVYEDAEGNQYNVYTYKYIENGQEKMTTPGETITTPLFNKIKIINYLDIDEGTPIEIHIAALAVQAYDGTAEEMWQYYKNQNGTVIVGVE